MTVFDLLIIYIAMAAIWATVTITFIVLLLKTRRTLLEFKKSADAVKEYAAMFPKGQPVFMGELHPDDDGNINIGDLIKRMTGDGGKPN